MTLLAAAVYGFAALVRKADVAWIKRAPLWLFLSMYFVGMWGHTYWVAYFALMLALPIAAKSRGEAAALFAVLVVYRCRRCCSRFRSAAATSPSAANICSVGWA